MVETGERIGLLDEGREDPCALRVRGTLKRIRLGDLEHEKALRPGLSYEPHRSDSPLTERFDELVALDEPGFLLLRWGRRRRRAANRSLHRVLEERGRDRPERREPDLEHRQ